MTPRLDIGIAKPLLSFTFSPIIAATSVIAFRTVVSPLNLGWSKFIFKSCTGHEP
ncbi:hypothetical protein Hanom_Chr15g01408841 [Helianthus anomalus]